MVLTSFALARLDEKLLRGVSWHRVVVDEAQNIKNPQAAQTRAILKLAAPHRLALTGTPGREPPARSLVHLQLPQPRLSGQGGAVPQGLRGADPAGATIATRSATLKKLAEPFILRRVKTDKRIIDDLPDKIEQKMYCTLTPEQASLYEAVVKDVARAARGGRGHPAPGPDPGDADAAQADLQPPGPVPAGRQRLHRRALAQAAAAGRDAGGG